jgi:hypothetical protein
MSKQAYQNAALGIYMSSNCNNNCDNTSMLSPRGGEEQGNNFFTRHH